MAEAYTLMERKLLHIIMHPAMTLTFIFGLGMVYLNPSFLKAGWFHFKLLGVAVLLGYQIFSGVVHKRFARGDFFLSEKSCRIINEVPTLCLVLIVFWVVFK